MAFNSEGRGLSNELHVRVDRKWIRQSFASRIEFFGFPGIRDSLSLSRNQSGYLGTQKAIHWPKSMHSLWNK